MGNMTLSQRRASAVASWLAGNGIKRVRLLTAGMGDSQPVADNTTEAGRAKNDRVELVKLASQPE
jgi:outer membrane protein OmpA-like peptidoglycan-associated protein